jgi:hypothetical protein
MLTPAYSLTATERVLPRLALDFTTASLDARVTVTRALNTGTRVNSSGLIETVNANLPRFDYDPITKICKGLLIEESRANIVPYSSAFGSWTNNAITVTADAVVAPDGTTTADDLERTSATSNNRSQTITFTGNATKSVSIFVRYNSSPSFAVFLFDSTASANRMLIDFTFTAGVPAVGSINSGSLEAIENYGNGWYRIKMLCPSVVAANTNVLYVYPARTGSLNNQKTTFWGAQAEDGAFATSYIFNAAAGTTTRNADAVSMTGTNFSDWYNATVSGTAVVSAITKGGLNNTMYVFDDTSSTQYANIVIVAANGSSTSGTMSYSVRANSVTTYSDIKASQMTNNTLFNTALFFASSNFSSATNGGTPATQTSGAVPATANILRLGSHRDGTILNGWLAKFAYYSPPFISAQTQAFSK